MQNDQTPLYVRLAADPSRRLERAVLATGKSKRQLVEDAVNRHLGSDGLVVGRATLHEPAPEILTLGEAAALLRVPESDVESAARRHELPGRRIGAEWRFLRDALLSWLKDASPTS